MDIFKKQTNLYCQLISDSKGIVFAWIPGHVCARGNIIVDLATKRSLENTVSKRLSVPYSGFKVLTNVYTQSLWQMEWDRYPENMLHKTQPKWIIPFHVPPSY